jgi:protein-disulfide isomerase
MRLTEMKLLRRLVAACSFSLVLSLAAMPAMAQRAVPPGSGDTFKDTSMIKPPAGAKVAVYEFQDLECPACSHAFPIVHHAVAHYNIPLIEKDFPLNGHIWSMDAAIWARYLQDKVSPKTAEDYRGTVFAAQTSINSKDDLLNFTRRFFQTHGVQMPFVPDATGQLSKEVIADRSVGEKMGLQHTPTIFVCTQHAWVQVTDISMLYQTIQEMISQAGSESVAKTPVKKSSH